MARHGHSTPNLANLIVSKIENGIKPENGLTSKGLAQATLSGQLFAMQIQGKPIVIISSPFSRALETANAIATSFDVPVKLDENLRERSFGDFELTSGSNYQQFWDKDILDGDSNFANSESPNQVQKRMLSVVTKCENSNMSESYIVLVSHADALLILETHFRQIPPKLHHSLPYILNAEIRSLN